jgi:hypothetical protein
VSKLTVWDPQGGPTGAVTNAPDSTAFPYTTNSLMLTLNTVDANLIPIRGQGRKTRVSIGLLALVVLQLMISILQEIFTAF